MTREEAKEVFLNRGFSDGIYNGDKWREACIVISKWLEQEPTTKNDLGVDCISRKAAEDITWQDPSYTDPLNILTEVRDKIRELPSVTPQEPRKGHWILAMPGGAEEWAYKCSECNFYKFKKTINLRKFKYCPSCGAKMVEPQESEDKEQEDDNT